MASTDSTRARFWARLAELRPAPDELRGALAEQWLGAARAEHASVASFGRFSLQLLTLGAPAALVQQAHEAALDEVEHGRICYALASAYRGASLGPGPLPGAVAPIEASVEAVLCANVEEGCVGETLSALEAREAGRRATDPVIRLALEVIAEDEERHAHLAWATWGWGLRAFPSSRAATEAAFERAVQGVRLGIVGGDEGAALEVHGRLSGSSRRALALESVDQVLRPAREALG